MQIKVRCYMEEKIKFTVGGAEFLLSREDVEQKLQSVEPERIREVAVEINGRQYPVKQALAEVTQLLRGNFTSHDAMRVFRKLSFPLKAETTPGMAVFKNTAELACPICRKPYMLKLSPQLAWEGCSCDPPRKPIEVPEGAVATDLGGLWIVRVPSPTTASVLAAGLPIDPATGADTAGSARTRITLLSDAPAVERASGGSHG